MEDQPSLSPEQAQEYNVNYEEGLGLLENLIQVHESREVSLGWIARRRARKGIVCLERCLAVLPQAWQCMWFIGKTHQVLNEHEPAFSWFEKALAHSQDNPDVPREASLEAMCLGQGAKAERYARHACELNSRNAGLVSNLALALLLNKKVDEALDTAARAVSMDTDNQISHIVLKYASKVKTGSVPFPQRISGQLPL